MTGTVGLRVASVVAALHLAIWLALFRSAFAALDAGESVDLVQGLALNVLGAPLMFVLYLPPTGVSTSTRWWGDSTTAIVALAVLNSVLWGVLVAWVFRVLQRRRQSAASQQPASQQKGG